MSYHSLHFNRRNGHTVFLDRDETIIKGGVNGPILDPKDLEFKKEAIRGLKLMQHLGYRLIVVSNQGGIGRGEYMREQCESVNAAMKKKLISAGVLLDAIYYCPHKKEDNCRCRKPKIGMLEKAVEEHGVNLNQSCIAGNSYRDVKAGNEAGITSFLVGEDNIKIDGCEDAVPDFRVKNLYFVAMHLRRE